MCAGGFDFVPVKESLYIDEGFLPTLATKDDLFDLCRHAVDIGAYEVRLVGGERPWACINTGLYPMAPRRLTPDELKNVVSETFGARAVADVLGGTPWDPSIQVVRGREEKPDRFRVNITSVYRRGDSIMLVLRYIPSKIPTTTQIGLDEGLVNYINRLENGVVMFVGTTGTGKSTSLASLIKHRLEFGAGSERLVTAEAPVEFVYDEVDGEQTIAQMEVGRSIGSFSEAIENYLRQNPSMFLLGEARDAETINAALHAGVTGPLVFTTAHANDVAGTIPRLLNSFPPDQKHSAMMSMIDGLNVIVAQKLLPLPDDAGRVAVRETLIITEEVREELRACAPETIGRKVREILRSQGSTMTQAGQKLLEEGVISADVYERLKFTYGK